jgi:hypothetical protein
MWQQRSTTVIAVQAAQMRVDLCLAWKERSMITVILWLGTALGFAIGLLHATQIVATESQDSSPDRLFTRIYRAIWAIGLWTLFGAYLLVLWLTAFILKLAFAKRTAGEQAA